MEGFEEGDGLPFYRCKLCASIVSVWDIEKHGACGKCGGKQIASTNLTLFEKLVQVIKHPMLWRWKSVNLPTDAG